ncbi:ATP-binding protein [Streptomyces hundungensis]|uniref:ATP-binding protein n=1 Tax=Streptomyces hundungensis TaxID=1077946 RepID=UPI0033F375C5
MDARKAERNKRAAHVPTVCAPRRSIYDPANGHFRSLTVYAESPDCAKAARDMVGSCLRAWGLPRAVDDAQLVVSELVGNVVHHAVPDECPTRPGGARKIDVLVKAWPGWLFIGVTDEDSSPPDLPAGERVSPELAGDFAEALLPDRGRGLLLVQRLADAMWWSPNGPSGKTVWCRFDLDGTT